MSYIRNLNSQNISLEKNIQLILDGRYWYYIVGSTVAILVEVTEFSKRPQLKLFTRNRSFERDRHHHRYDTTSTMPVDDVDVDVHYDDESELRSAY